MPANAATSASRLDRGRWKLVSKRIDGAETMTRADDEIGTIASRLEGAAGRRRALERSHRGRADRDDPAAGGARRLDGARRSRPESCSAPKEHCGRSSDVVRTGRNVAGPTSSVSGDACDAASRERAMSSGVKWRPAVGAAIAPGVRANIV